MVSMPSLVLAVLLAIQAQTPTGVVAGRLRLADGMPAAGIRVSAMLAPDGARQGDADVGALFSQTQTEVDGRYRLENIPPGRYFIMAGRVDAPTYYPGRTDQLAATAVSVASGSPIEGIDFTIEEFSARVPAASAGLVFGQFLPTLPVAIQFHADSGTRIPVMSPRGRTQVSARPTSTAIPASGSMQPDGSMPLMVSTGEYRFSVDNLPDEYEVKSMSAGPVDILRQSLQVNGPPPPIHVTVGLKSAPPPRRPGRVVRGRVLDGITTMPWTAEAVFLSGTPGSVFSDGSFEFSGVAAGRYVVEAREGAPGNRTAQANIVVGTSDVTANLTYTSIPANVRIAGRVVVEGGNAPRLNTARILATGTAVTPIPVAADGTFKTALQEGAYQVSAEGFPPGLTVKSITSGNVDLRAGALEIQPRNGPGAPDVVVTLMATPRVKVRGRVLADPPTRPVEGAEVLLNGGPEVYRTTVAADGTFELPAVLPGEYKIAVRPFGFSNVNETVVVANLDLDLEFKSQPLY
jgi:hypothetical protein